VDKHCVKMILEYAQLLSTAHRVIDGVQGIRLSEGGRRLKNWVLPDDREDFLYKATHVNHPSAVWASASKENYIWLSKLFIALLDEYTYRYGKHHKSGELVDYLSYPPDNIPNIPFTQPTPAMPDHYKSNDSIKSYRDYYIGEKFSLFSWKNRPIPNWVSTKELHGL
jgi:hypothetical protein